MDAAATPRQGPPVICARFPVAHEVGAEIRHAHVSINASLSVSILGPCVLPGAGVRTEVTSRRHTGVTGVTVRCVRRGVDLCTPVTVVVVRVLPTSSS